MPSRAATSTKKAPLLKPRQAPARVVVGVCRTSGRRASTRKHKLSDAYQSDSGINPKKRTVSRQIAKKKHIEEEVVEEELDTDVEPTENEDEEEEVVVPQETTTDEEVC